MVTKMTPDVNIVLLDIDYKTNEVVSENEDGSYTIVINARLNEDGRIRAYKHAMHHINNIDFAKDNVQQIEHVAHAINIPDSAERIPALKYQERIKDLQKEKRRIQRKVKRDQERVQFLRDNYDMFRLAEHYYLYGDDL